MHIKETLTCFDCKNFEDYLREEENRPCEYRDYPDYKNVCHNFRRKSFRIVTRGDLNDT